MIRTRLVSACCHTGARSSGGRFGKRVNDAWVALDGGEDDWAWSSGVTLMSDGDITTSERFVLVSGCGPTVAIALLDRSRDVQNPARVRLWGSTRRGDLHSKLSKIAQT